MRAIRPLAMRMDRPEFRGRPWRLVLPVVFGVLILRHAIVSVLDPSSLGWHATFYTDAAAAWLAGQDPWRTGPPGIIFAGPPTMLLAFAPWVELPAGITRFIWVVGSAVLAVDVLRRLRLPMYFLAFPPLFEAISIGHPEVLVLWLVVATGRMSGLAAFIKPYAIFALIAERRLAALVVLAAAVVATIPILPWARFIAELTMIQQTLAIQANGDSVFGMPLMVVGAVALASLGWRRALWLATPVLWPNAQFIYKLGSIPQLSPIIALCWALPIPGATLAGVVIEALLLELRPRLTFPGWLDAALAPFVVTRQLATR
jgi:hypothetical protein